MHFLPLWTWKLLQAFVLIYIDIGMSFHFTNLLFPASAMSVLLELYFLWKFETNVNAKKAYKYCNNEFTCIKKRAPQNPQILF